MFSLVIITLNSQFSTSYRNRSQFAQTFPNCFISIDAHYRVSIEYRFCYFLIL